MTDDMIVRLRSWNVDGRTCTKVANALEAKDKMIAELKAALKPFSDEAKVIDESYMEGCELDDGEIATYGLTMGDLRKARSLLEQK